MRYVDIGITRSLCVRDRDATQFFGARPPRPSNTS